MYLRGINLKGVFKILKNNMTTNTFVGSFILTFGTIFHANHISHQREFGFLFWRCNNVIAKYDCRAISVVYFYSFAGMSLCSVRSFFVGLSRLTWCLLEPTIFPAHKVEVIPSSRDGAGQNFRNPTRLVKIKFFRRLLFFCDNFLLLL